MIKLEGGRIYDPANGIDGKLMDLYIKDGKLVKPTAANKVHQANRPERQYRHGRWD